MCPSGPTKSGHTTAFKNSMKGLWKKKRKLLTNAVRWRKVRHTWEECVWPFLGRAIPGKSRKEEMMAPPSPASAPLPLLLTTMKRTSLPQGQSPHPGSESLPDNFLCGAFPSLQGLHRPLLHWSLPSRMCSWFLPREGEDGGRKEIPL